MKNTLLLFFLFSVLTIHAQVLEITVTDLVHVPIKKVEIENVFTEKRKRTNIEGKAYFRLDTTLLLEISSEAYDSKLLRVAPKPGLDTLRRKVALAADFQLLETVEITSGRVKSAVNIKNVNVIDYMPYTDHILALVKFEGKRYLTLNNHLNESLLEKKLYFWQRELEMTEDCLGNVHVHTNDSSYQVDLNDSVFYLVQARTKESYLNEFGACFADFDEHQFYSIYELHDRVYNVFSAKKSNKSVAPVFSIFDEETYLSSKTLLNEIVLLYCLNRFGKFNIITAGIWDGNLDQLAVTKELVQRIAFYKALISKASGVRAFKYKDEVVVVDQISGVLHKAQSNGTFIGEFPFDFNGLDSPWFMQDRTTEQIYTLEKDAKKVHVYKLDFEKSKIVLTTTIDDYSYPENIKIDNGWIYFLGFQNQFKKLLRIKLKE